MAKRMKWENLRHAGKRTLCIADESLPPLPKPTKAQEAQYKAENIDRHNAAKKFKKDLKKRRKQMRREEELSRNPGSRSRPV